VPFVKYAWTCATHLVLTPLRLTLMVGLMKGSGRGLHSKQQACNARLGCYDSIWCNSHELRCCWTCLIIRCVHSRQCVATPVW
jgi:hypothetical protein